MRTACVGGQDVVRVRETGAGLADRYNRPSMFYGGAVPTRTRVSRRGFKDSSVETT